MMRAADDLRHQHLRAAAVEQALQRSRVVGGERPGCAELAGSEQTQRQRSPDAADAVNRNRADRIVDAQLLQQFDAVDHDDAGDCRPAESRRSG